MKRLFLILLASLAVICSCSKAKEDVHVVVIGLDGWGSYSMGKADMPNVKALMKDGAYTLRKRSMLPSHSATNWAAMFMGVGPQIHGFTGCCSPSADIEPAYVNEYGIFPTVFRLLRDKRPDAEIGLFYDWDGLAAVLDTLAFSYREFYQSSEEGRTDAVAKADKYIKEKTPDLTFFYFGETDHVGHAVGHDTPEYYQTEKIIDEYIGKLIQSVKDAGIYDNTVFVVSADHGGIGRGHGGITLEEMESPLIFCGKGIKKLGDMNLICAQVDIAPSIAKVLGVEFPVHIWGRTLDEVFE